jgi:hypothetical protein
MLGRPTWLVALSAVAVLGLAGCATSAHDQVLAKVRQYASATARHEYRTLCTQVLAPVLLARLRSGGIPCDQAMSIGLQGVQDPSLAIGRVVLHGRHASVTTITTARGQAAALEAIELVDTGAGWRITSLGAPQFPR